MRRDQLTLHRSNQKTFMEIIEDSIIKGLYVTFHLVNRFDCSRAYFSIQKVKDPSKFFLFYDIQPGMLPFLP